MVTPSFVDYLTSCQRNPEATWAFSFVGLGQEAGACQVTPSSCGSATEFLPGSHQFNSGDSSLRHTTFPTSQSCMFLRELGM